MVAIRRWNLEETHPRSAGRRRLLNVEKLVAGG